MARVSNPCLGIADHGLETRATILFAGKPIIGLAGGIGSGKSHVAGLLREMGCLVIDSDAQVREAYEDQAVRDQVRRWWGSEAFTAEGRIDRRAVARHIFASSQERDRLEQLLHPLVGAARDKQMAASAANPAILAFVWDTPLLFEKGLNRECDAVVYIDADFDQRLLRVTDSRGWNEEELRRREIFQWPLDKKRSFSDYVVQSPADAEELRRQVHQTLSRILANKQ